MKSYRFKLYIVKENPYANLLVQRVDNILKKVLKVNYQFDIIDILENPELAKQDKVLASPTLIKESPQPQKRLIGQFDDDEKIVTSLQLLENNDS